ncbi:RNA polymerase sigma factor [Chondromyces crocatus]|nr:sigma-70 family RNA polymerase sigma factor [Chondromyces crocatus]
MNPQQREELEVTIRSHAEGGDLAGAAEIALRGYGREIFEFLAALHRQDDDAAEVFSLFAEGLWRGLPRFGWRSSFRTWAYAVARKASLRFRRDARRRAARGAPLPDSSRLEAIAAEVRTQTQSWLQTERKNRFTALRESLPSEDQALLLLRVDRQLSWIDLARVLHEDDGAPLEGDALKREAARLRKRFQLIKEKLYEMGRREGLVRRDDDDT